MLSFTVTIFLTLFLAASAGSLVPAPVLSPAKKVAFRLMAGLALLFSAFLVCNAWLAQEASAWWLVTALAFSHLLDRGRGLLSMWADFKQIPLPWLAPRLLAQATVLLFLAIPCMREGTSCLYDGTGNNDNQQFATDALWVRQNGYLRVPGFEPAHPQYWLSLTVTGWTPHSGRICAQETVAFLSVLMNQDPVWVYSPFFATQSVFWSLSLALLARRIVDPARVGARGLLLADLLGICHPAGFFFITNGNLANGFGATLACFALFLFRSIQCGDFAVRHGILVFITVFALAGTYPEMVPFLGLLCAGSCIMDALVARSALRRACWWTPAAAALLALAAFPPTTCRLWSTIQTAKIMMRTARLDSTANSFSIFANLNPLGHFSSAATLATQLGDKVPSWVHGLLAASILTALIALAGKSRDRPLTASILLVYCWGAWMVASAGYGYGWQKIHQYLSGPFAALLIAGIGLLAIDKPPGSTGVLAKAAVSLLAVWFLAGFGSHVRIMARISGEKSLSTEHLEVRQALSELHEQGIASNSTVVIHDQTFPTFWSSYFHSMWLNHFSGGLPIAYDDAGTGGGYLKAVSQKQSQMAAPSNLHVWGAGSLIRPGGQTLYQGRFFHLVADPQILSVQGLLREEKLSPGGKWVPPPWKNTPDQIRSALMERTLLVKTTGSADGWLEVSLLPTSPTANPDPGKGVKLVSGAHSVPVGGQNKQTLRIPVQKGCASVPVHIQGDSMPDQPFCRIIRIEFIPKAAPSP